MASPKLRGEGGSAAEIVGENSGNSITSLQCSAPAKAQKGDLILILVQATTDEAGKFPTISASTTTTIYEPGETGKDEETGGQQTSRLFAIVNQNPGEGTMTTTTITTSEKCKIQIVTVAVQVGTFNPAEPIKGAGMRQSSGEGGKCPTPAVSGLTSEFGYLAVSFFGYKSGQVEVLSGWSLGNATGKYSVLYRQWTGITTTGEPAFTKAGPTVRALTGIIVVQPLTEKVQAFQGALTFAGRAERSTVARLVATLKPEPVFIAALIKAFHAVLTSVGVVKQKRLISFVTSAKGTYEARTSGSIPKPAEVAVGDVMLASIYLELNETIAMSGWTLASTRLVQANGTTFSFATFWKVYEGEAGPYAVTWNGTSHGMNWRLGAYRFVNQNSPINAAGGQTNSGSTSTAETAPSITPTVSNTRLVFTGANSNGNEVAGGGDPAGFTKRQDTGGYLADGFGPAANVATGAKTETLGAAAWYAAQLIALTPETPNSIFMVTLSAVLSLAGSIAGRSAAARVAASLAPSGKQPRATSRPLSAATAPAGHQPSSTTRGFAGALQPIGSLRAAAAAAMRAALSLVGRQPLSATHPLSAAAKPAGSLAPAPSALLRAALSLAGAIRSAAVAHPLFASLKPTGTLTTAGQKIQAFLAQLSFAGRQPLATSARQAAALALSSRQAVAVVRLLSATLKPAAGLLEQFVHGFKATLSFASRQPTSVVARLLAALSPSGRQSTATVHPLAASTQPQGRIASAVLRLLSASLKPAGALQRQTSAPRRATLAPAGALKRAVTARLAAALSFEGRLPSAVRTLLKATLAPAGRMTARFANVVFVHPIKAILGLAARFKARRPEPVDVTPVFTAADAVTLAFEQPDEETTSIEEPTPVTPSVEKL
jgi:hypothetical protein